MKAGYLQILAVFAACVLLLSGCKSSKSIVVRGGAGYGTTTTTVKRDYSHEHADPMGLDLVEEARTWLGTPYRYGGRDRSGTDCSGMMMELYRNVCAVKIPRTTKEQKSYCTEVARNKTRVGDLVFFGSRNGVSHVGLYIGKGEMIHASSSRGVMVSNIDGGYWGDRYIGAGRVAGAEKGWAANAGRSKRKRGGKVDKKPEAVPPVMEVPTVDRPLGVPAVTLEELASVSCAGHSDDNEVELAAAGEVVRKPENPPATGNNAAAVSTEPEGAAGDAVEAIDLLDLIINEKVDSIFSNRFMD